MQPRLPVQVLALEAQVLLLSVSLWDIPFRLPLHFDSVQASRLPALFYRGAPGLVLGLPNDLALGVAKLFWQAYLVGVEVVHLTQLGIRAGSVCAGVLCCAFGIERLPVFGFQCVVGRLLGVYFFWPPALTWPSLAAMVFDVFGCCASLVVPRPPCSVLSPSASRRASGT